MSDSRPKGEASSGEKGIGKEKFAEEA